MPKLLYNLCCQRPLVFVARLRPRTKSLMGARIKDNVLQVSLWPEILRSLNNSQWPLSHGLPGPERPQSSHKTLQHAGIFPV